MAGAYSLDLKVLSKALQIVEWMPPHLLDPWSVYTVDDTIFEKSFMKTFVLGLSLVMAVILNVPTQAETKLTQPWSDRAFINNHGPFKNILVIGVPEEPDERRKLEEAFSKVLKKNGVEAMPSLEFMSADTEINKENVLAAVAGKDFDSVLLTRLYRVEEIDIVEIDDPGTKRSQRDFALGLWADYRNAHDYALDAAKKKQLRVVLENSVYDLKSAELVWTVQSYSMDPKSADDVIKSLSRLISDSLKKEKLI